MKSRRVALLQALLVVILFTFGATQSFGQYTWKQVGKFNASIGSGYFFDANNGLIGSGVRWNPNLGDPTFPCAIYRTTDGGATWTQSTVPHQLLGAVTQIYMQDATTGYASIMPANTGGGNSALWKTTDGGITWTDPFHFDHALTCVYGSGNLIVTTTWDRWNSVPNAVDGGLVSTDGGQTWQEGLQSVGGGNGANGVAFSDALNGVVSEMNPNTYDPQNPVNAHWYTVDGGRTWNETISKNQYESWSVYAVPNQHIFFTANEGQLDVPHQQVNWSTDGGATWSRRFYFPHMQFTGTINGKDSTLYVQTDTTAFASGADPSVVQGMYRSDDFGLTWKFIGGPAHSRDTRFVVTGCSGEVVYAFDAFGGVWKTTDGGDGTLKSKSGSATITLPSRTMDYAVSAKDACKPIVISMPFMASGCGNATIDSIAVSANSNFVLNTNGSVPRTFSQDSINIVYQRPADAHQALTDSVIVFVHYHSSSQTATESDTFVVHLPAASAFAIPRRAVAVGAYAQPVDLPLKEILPQFVLDSLRLSGLATASMTVTYDPSELSYTFFANPATLATTSIKQSMSGVLTVNYRNSGWIYSAGDFDLGTVRMTVQTRQPSEALLSLQSLNFVTQKGGSVYPCLTTVEDNQWQIEVQNMLSVSDDAAASALRLAPSPFRDHIIVTNGEEHGIMMTLCDLLGREVATFNANASGESQWNTSQLRPGMYVIYWQENGRLHSVKLTKTE